MTIKVFVSYAHEDEVHRRSLDKHLSTLKRERVIEIWHDRILSPGDQWATEVSEKLATSQIIILLVSPDFLASDYCNEVELVHALKMHREGKARIVPVILSACDWRRSAIGSLQALPTDGQPITEAEFPN